MRAVEKIADYGRSNEASEIADRIDESYGRSGCRFAEKNGGNRPKGRKKRVGGGCDDYADERKPEMRAGENEQRKRYDSQHEGNGSVPAAFVGSVGMPAVQDHGEKDHDVRNNREHGYGEIGHVGGALEKSGKPNR